MPIEKLKKVNGELVFVKEYKQPKPREHKKILHEEVAEKFEISIDKDYGKHMKILPKEWIFDIVNQNIQYNKDDSIETINYNKPQNTILIQFMNKDDSREFEKKFNVSLFKTMTNFIQSKDENPKNYNRNLLLHVTTQDFQMIIIY